MSEITENLPSLQTLPTEIFINILYRLPARELMKCRLVCLSWKLVIDELASKENYWEERCKYDYKNYLSARRNSRLNYFHLYRSLSMWSKLAHAREEDDEFAPAAAFRDEVCNIEVLYNGFIAVHKKTAIEYYDIDTLQLSKQRCPIIGEYARYTENQHAAVVQNYHLHLFVLTNHNGKKFEYTNTIDNVKLFYLKGTKLYHVSLTDEIYLTEILGTITTKFIKKAEENDVVMSLGYKDGQLTILTYKRNIFTVVDNNVVYQQTLASEQNLLNVVNHYNFLEQLDWRVYFQWMYVFRHTIPDGVLKDIICIRTYGDIFFVGSNFGVLCVFYKPYINGQLNLFETKPLVQVHFMERSDIPVLANCPILQIDVIEREFGHSVFVAMPKKVAVLNFKHDFLNPVSWSLDIV